MPKINGKPVDPKAYSKRVTEAKKTLARTSPEVKRKIAEMYPKVNGKDIVNKALSPKLMKKNAKPIEDRKKNTPPKMPRQKLPGTPVPLTPRTSGKPGYKTMPKVGPNLTRPRGQRTGPKQAGPAGPKVKSPSVKPVRPKTPSPSAKTKYGPLPKNPTLNDYLMRGIRPPSKNKPGTRPSDADVIIKGYNDPATIKKYKKK